MFSFGYKSLKNTLIQKCIFLSCNTYWIVGIQVYKFVGEVKQFCRGKKTKQKSLKLSKMNQLAIAMMCPDIQTNNSLCMY